MEIRTIDVQESGSLLVNKNVDPNDARQMLVPASGSRFDEVIQEWLDAGNTPEPYVAPVKTWSENRLAEYPTIAELVVGLYDMDDKAALEKRRADTKAKYPKPV